MQMELRHLRSFVVLAEELNFRRAAERLYISAPALSVQIKQLEDMLGVRLCERDTTKVRLTPPGEVLLYEARHLLHQARQAELATKEAARGNRGTLRIGNPGYFGYSFMPEVLACYRERFPEVDISLVELDVELEQPQALENGTIQVGFSYGPQLHLLKDIENLLVIDTPMRVVMAPGHPLAASRQVSLAMMAGHPLLSVLRYDSHMRNMLALFHEHGLKPKATKKVDGFNAYIAMLAAGEGVSMLPEMLVLLQTGRVVTRPLKEEGPDLRLHVHAVWKKHDSSEHVRNFVEALRQSGVRND